MQDPDSDPSPLSRLSHWIKKKWRYIFRADTESSLRETIEELIEESDNCESSIELDERTLLGNVLSLRDLTAQDAMIPRVDIIAIPFDATEEELLGTFIRSRLQRLPVYRNTLDEVVGSVQIQDVLAWKSSGKPLQLRSILKDVLFISPAMRTLDLIFKMRESGTKMALVVDEFGGIDGLVTFSDLMEEIIGDIQDAQDQPTQQRLFSRPDGQIVADGRVMLEEIEETFDLYLTIEDLEDEVETIGGLVTSLVGHVPSRGELISHPSQNITFEILEADPRRVKRLLIHKNVEVLAGAMA